jgi:hypothetical protein
VVCTPATSTGLGPDGALLLDAFGDDGAEEEDDEDRADCEATAALELEVDGAPDDVVFDGAEDDELLDGAEDEELLDGAEDEELLDGAEDEELPLDELVACVHPVCAGFVWPMPRFRSHS